MYISFTYIVCGHKEVSKLYKFFNPVAIVINVKFKTIVIADLLHRILLLNVGYLSGLV